MSGGGDTDADDDDEDEEFHDDAEDEADACKRSPVDACREPAPAPVRNDGDAADERGKSGVPDADWRAESATPLPSSSSTSLANDASFAFAALPSALALTLTFEAELGDAVIAAVDGDGDRSALWWPSTNVRSALGLGTVWAAARPFAALTDAVSLPIALPATAALDFAASAALALPALPLGCSLPPPSCFPLPAASSASFCFCFSSARTKSAI